MGSGAGTRGAAPAAAPGTPGAARAAGPGTPGAGHRHPELAVPVAATGFSPPRKFGQPGCRARHPGRHPGCRGPAAASGEMRWRFTSRAYLERISSVRISVAQSPRRLIKRADRARQVWGAAPRHPGRAGAAPGAGTRGRCRGGTRGQHPRCRPGRHPRCPHHTKRKLAGRVDSPSRAQIAPPRGWLVHTLAGVVPSHGDSVCAVGAHPSFTPPTREALTAPIRDTASYYLSADVSVPRLAGFPLITLFSFFFSFLSK